MHTILTQNTKQANLTIKSYEHDTQLTELEKQTTPYYLTSVLAWVAKRIEQIYVLVGQ